MPHIPAPIQLELNPSGDLTFGQTHYDHVFGALKIKNLFEFTQSIRQFVTENYPNPQDVKKVRIDVLGFTGWIVFDEAAIREILTSRQAFHSAPIAQGAAFILGDGKSPSIFSDVTEGEVRALTREGIGVLTNRAGFKGEFTPLVNIFNQWLDQMEINDRGERGFSFDYDYNAVHIWRTGDLILGEQMLEDGQTVSFVNTSRMIEMYKYAKAAFDATAFGKFINLPIFSRFLPGISQIKEVKPGIDAEIENIVRFVIGNPNSTKGGILKEMISLVPEHLREKTSDEVVHILRTTIMNIIFAANDTTLSMAAGVLNDLGSRPELFNALKAELATFDIEKPLDMAKLHNILPVTMHYLNGGLREHHPAFITARECVQDFQGEYISVAGGDTTLLALGAAAENSSLANEDYAAFVSNIAFGAGHTRCPGGPLAFVRVLALLIAITRKFDYFLLQNPNEIYPLGATTTTMAGGKYVGGTTKAA